MKKDSLKSKNELRRCVNTSIRTVMIGALASFEKYFGEIWAHNEDKKTEQEEKLFDLWMQARSEILQRGNDSIEIANREINKNTIKKKDYYHDFRN